MDGVALGARFSIATNRLQYCGPAEAEPALYATITRGERRDEARAALGQFEALVPYLEAIGRKHGLDPFDARVVEAYWVGNELLDPFTKEDFREILAALTRRGLPRSVAALLSDELPARPFPHHVFHVSFVGVGSVTGHVETTRANIESCRPSWGTVRELGGDRMTLEVAPLLFDARGARLGRPAAASLPRDSAVLPDLAVGQSVAYHWGCPALVLTESQEAALRRYTERSLQQAHPMLARRGVLSTGAGPRRDLD